MDERNYWQRQREDVLEVSQRALARELDMSNQTVSDWESDKRAPNIADAGLLAPHYRETRERIEAEIVAQVRRIESTAPAAK